VDYTGRKGDRAIGLREVGMRGKMLYGICLLASVALGLAAVTPEVTVYTEEDPPYNFAGNDGRPDSPSR
jgi:hypothetical protein